MQRAITMRLPPHYKHSIFLVQNLLVNESTLKSRSIGIKDEEIKEETLYMQQNNNVIMFKNLEIVRFNLS